MTRPEWPETYAAYPNDPRLKQEDIFDPALQHFSRGFRKGEPTFVSIETAVRWRSARRLAMEHILRVVAGSAWRDNLVLRGSFPLKVWLGPLAREPGDLDWLVVPDSKQLLDAWSDQLFQGIIAAVVSSPAPLGLRFLPERIGVDDIWTYDRAPGRRIVFVWQMGDQPQGTIQFDVVFREKLWQPPITLELRSDTGSSISLLAASRELSLTWKLLWLQTDSNPQGKDLYDAAILANQTSLEKSLVDQVISASVDKRWLSNYLPITPLDWHVEWESFQTEYPWISGTVEDWKAKLNEALMKKGIV